MGSLVFTISYGVNEGLILSPSELLEQFFYGIPLCAKNGQEISMETIKEKILSAQDFTEKFFSIRLNRSVETENADFIRGDWNSWGYIRNTFPVRNPISLVGLIGTVQQIEYPIEWISSNKRVDESQLFRNLHIVPVGTTSPTVSNSILFSGITPNLGFMGLDSIPNYWSIVYETGFSSVPPNLQEFVGKLAAIELFVILGDILLGIGVASESLSLDGLSQSLTTTRGGLNSLFMARIKMYLEDIQRKEKILKDYYKGIGMGVC